MIKNKVNAAAQGHSTEKKSKSVLKKKKTKTEIGLLKKIIISRYGGKGQRREGERKLKKLKMCYVRILIPHNVCNYEVQDTRADNHKNHTVSSSLFAKSGTV